MSDEQFALSTSAAPSPPPPTEADYEAILAAVMETVRGRWFLSDFGRRNRQADTRLVLSAIERLESMMRGGRESPSFARIRFDIREMAKAIALTKREIAAIKPDHDHSGRIGKATEQLDSILHMTEQATSDILAAAEHIQETAWTLREQGVDGAACDELDRRSTDIYLACSFQDLTGQRIRKVIQVMRYLEGRINAMLDILGVDAADTVPSEPPSEGPERGAGDFDTSLDQSEIDQVMPAVHAVHTVGEEHDGTHASDRNGAGLRTTAGAGFEDKITRDEDAASAPHEHAVGAAIFEGDAASSVPDVPPQAPDEPASLSDLERSGAPALNQPFAPDTQALLADLLSIIRPVAPDAETPATAQEFAADDQLHVPAGDAVGAGDAARPAAMAAQTASGHNEIHPAPAVDAASPDKAMFAAAGPGARSPLTASLPLDHVHIVEPGIMSSDLTIVAAEGLPDEPEAPELLAEADDVPAGADPAEPAPELSDTDIVAIDQDDDFFLPHPEFAPSPRAVSARLPPAVDAPVLPPSPVVDMREQAAARPGAPAPEHEPAAPAASHSAVGSAVAAVHTTERITAPPARETAPRLAATPQAIPTAVANVAPSGRAPASLTSASGPGHPLAAVAALTVEEKIALFS